MERVQLVYDSSVPQITEEILDSVQLVDVGSVVPLITEDGVDVVQVMPQERVQNRTQQQIVGDCDLGENRGRDSACAFQTQART